MSYKPPPEQRHRKGLDRPIHKHRDGDAAPMFPDLMKCSKVNLREHGNDHEPDEHGYRQVDVCDFSRADGLEETRKTVSQRNACGDAHDYPQTQIPLKGRHAMRPRATWTDIWRKPGT